LNGIIVNIISSYQPMCEYIYIYMYNGKKQKHHYLLLTKISKRKIEWKDDEHYTCGTSGIFLLYVLTKTRVRPT